MGAGSKHITTNGAVCHFVILDRDGVSDQPVLYEQMASKYRSTFWFNLTK